MEKNKLIVADKNEVMRQPCPAEMMQAMIEKGVTQENAAAFRELVLLSEHMEDRNAQRQFTAAFVALQAELPTIVATTVIPNRGKYEKFEDVMKQIQPFLTKHGFTASFSQDFKDNRIVITCDIAHAGGHHKPNSYTTRVSGKADSETQADSKASTTAKRNALLQAFNIVIRQDVLQDEDDAHNEGAFISHQQAEELQHRLKMVDGDELAFLKLAGVGAISGFPTIEHYRSILSGKYSMLNEALTKKEVRGR